MRFIADFISRGTLPSLEPACTAADFDAMDVTAIGVTIYRLGDKGAPESILAHWAYPQGLGRVRPRGRPVIAQP